MGKISRICAGLGLCCAAIAVGILVPWTQWSTSLMVFLSSFLLLCSVISLDICYLNPSDSHSTLTLLTQYFMVRIMPLLTHSSYTRFVTASHNIRSVQDDFLNKLLRKNAKTIYGKVHDFESITSRDQYVRSLPLTTYKDYEYYIEKMCKGEENVLTSDPLGLMALSSGTTGNCKKIPMTSASRWFIIRNVGFLTSMVVSHVTTLKRFVSVRLRPKMRYTPCGIPMHGVSHYMTPLPPYALLPRSAKKLEDETVTMYITALFALAEREVAYIDAMLSPIGYSFFKTIENCADSLCKDLEEGTLSSELILDDDLRGEINAALKADPARAAEVRQHINAGNEGLAHRIWPDLRFVGMNTSGAFSVHAKILQDTFLKGVYCKGFLHIASEGLVGIALDGEGKSKAVWTEQQYACAFPLLFFEFIPEEDISQEKPRTYFLDQLERDKTYEVVLTNDNGLYRYRLGDVIKVVDFFNQCPVYEFQYRLGQLLNLAFEKTPENVFYEAVAQAEKEWGDSLKIHDYTATESVNVELLKDYHSVPSRAKHYILFLEVTSNGEEYRLAEEECILIENNLRKMAFVYNTLREKNSIGPLEVVQVKSGTFLKVKSLLTSETNNQQYKTPRAMRRTDVLTLLLKCDIRLIVFDLDIRNNNISIL